MCTIVSLVMQFGSACVIYERQSFFVGLKCTVFIFDTFIFCCAVCQTVPWNIGVCHGLNAINVHMS